MGPKPQRTARCSPLNRAHSLAYGATFVNQGERRKAVICHKFDPQAIEKFGWLLAPLSGRALAPLRYNGAAPKPEARQLGLFIYWGFTRPRIVYNLLFINVYF